MFAAACKIIEKFMEPIFRNTWFCAVEGGFETHPSTRPSTHKYNKHTEAHPLQSHTTTHARVYKYEIPPQKKKFSISVYFVGGIKI